MTRKTRIRRPNSSPALLVPKQVADTGAVKEVDEVVPSTRPDGLTTSPFDPEFAPAMQDASEFMHSHQDAFGELAR